MALVHRTFLKGALLGAALTAILLLALGIWLQQSHRIILTGVGPWTTNAVKTEFAGLSVYFADKVFAEFEYSAENITNADYSLPAQSDAAFIRVADGKGLSHEEGLTWPQGKYLPPNKKVIVKFTVPFQFTEAFTSKDTDDNDKFAAFMGNRLKELDGFVILDRQTRYEIAFPMALRDLKPSASPASK